MSILIKGMVMPKSCLQCPFRKFWDDEDQCLAKKNLWVKGNEIPPVCPLVELPPHGRLIDADALIDKVIAKYLEHERKGELVFAAAEIKQDIVDIISDAPTIIEREGEE